MKGIRFGSLETNDGDITATAAIDGTVTAAIMAGDGQTLMAIYATGNYPAYAGNWFASLVRSGQTSGAMVVGRFITMDMSAGDESGWLTKHNFSLSLDGTSYIQHIFSPLKEFPPQTIVKIQITDSTDTNVVVAAGWGAEVDARGVT